MAVITASTAVGPKIRFNKHAGKDFVTELRDEVGKYFTDNNLSRHANTEMITKTVILLGGYVATYFVILAGFLPGWALLALCVLMGVLKAGIGMSVAHDAIHGAYSPRQRVNQWLSLTMNLIGGSDYVWSISHNVVHHTYTNIPDVDEDLEVAPFIRLKHTMKRKAIHKLQPVLAFMAYGLATVFWVFWKDYRKLWQASIGPVSRKHPRHEILKLIGLKLFYYVYTIAVPLMVMDITVTQFLIGFFVMHFTAGFILGIVFQLAHSVEETSHPEPDPSGLIDNAWAIHQMHTTANFAPKNRVLNWYVGGLNFQVEHHLFPKICSVHYPKLAAITERVARRHDVPYHVNHSFRGAVRSHFNLLVRYGFHDN